MTDEIRTDDLTSPETLALLELHLRGMHANSPAGSVHALDPSGLRRPDVTVWGLHRGGRLAGIGALRVIDATTGEVKSMRTHPDFLRQGVAAALLEHIMAQACGLGLRQLALETGSGAPFAAALALYERYGFRSGPPFGDYAPTAFNQFLRIELDAQRLR